MDNNAIERDDALESTVRQNRPIDKDKMTPITVYITNGVKMAIMRAGAERHMSMCKYAGLLLNQAIDPVHNPPPEKCADADRRAEGMTKQTEDALRDEIRRLKEDLKTSDRVYEEDQKEISALRKRCQELEAEQTPPVIAYANGGESGVIEKLFFACELLHDAGYSEGSDYYAALINTLGLMERFKTWRDEHI